MRTIPTITLASMLALAPVALAQQGPEPASQPKPPAEEAPKLVVPERVHDFGVITDDKKVRTEFVFRNEGKGTLVINNIRTTCGCTTPELEKKEYAPGESGQIVVYYDPHNRSGPQNGTVTIESNDPDNPRLPLTIKANIVRMLEVSPAIVRFGQVPKGESRAVMVDVTGRMPGFAIQDVEVMRVEGIEVEILDPETLEDETTGPAVRQTILLTLKNAPKIGPIQGALAIKVTDADGKITQKNISILGEVLGDLVLKPRQLNVGSVRPGMVVERHVTVSSRELRRFKILKVEERPLKGIDGKPRAPQLTDISFDAVPADPDDPNKYVVGFKFKPREEVVRQFFTQLVFITDRKDQPELMLRVLGRIDAPPTPNQTPAGAAAKPGG